MRTNIQKIRFLSFWTFFFTTILLFTKQFRIPTAIHITLLLWSFFVLCVPIPSNPLLTTKFLQFFTKRATLYAALITWLGAALLNVYTYFSMPFIYITSATTFLLYRIISNPWPYWIIIGTSSLAGMYKIFFLQPHCSLMPKKEPLFFHKFAKTALICLGLATFFYLSYLELVVFLFANTCAGV